ncbi:hypothetical protein [Aquisalimonas sp.]|uniref:hypothetical protein n=1 Tax=unclassified Aquisalimonas TaxID=2644645 RepID=UPI0025B7DD1D|nr:hypothetical protein [Aquisalimonas sp.]
MTVLTALLILIPLTVFATRLSLLARPLECDWFSLDVASGSVCTDTADGIREWELAGWFRHPWLCVLYLRGDDRAWAALVLPRDAMSGRCRRRLCYLLGVSTVGSASGNLSG